MRLSTTLVTLATTLSYAAFVPLTNGLACPVDGGSGQMSAMNMAMDSHSSGSSATAPAGRTPALPDAPCKSPAALGGCQSMTACVPVAMVSQHVEVRSFLREAFDVTPAEMLRPPSETKTPELPPPRA